MNLEEKLEETMICFTDKIWVHPNHWVEHYKAEPPVWKHKTLYVSCRDKSYRDIMEDVYAGLMGNKRNLFKIPKHERQILYKCYENNADIIKKLQAEMW